MLGSNMSKTIMLLTGAIFIGVLGTMIFKFVASFFTSVVVLSTAVNAKTIYGSNDWFYTDAEVAACAPIPVLIVIGDATKHNGDVLNGTTRTPSTTVTAKEGRMFDPRPQKVFSGYGGKNSQWAKLDEVERENGLFLTKIKFHGRTHQGATARTGVTVAIHAGAVVYEVAKTTDCLKALELLPE
jgi:hypothetical protein